MWRRIYRLFSSVRRRGVGSPVVPDGVLETNIHSALNQMVRHPGRIEVTATEGLVTMRGSILLDEMDAIGNRLSQLDGVKGIGYLWEICDPGTHVMDMHRHEPVRWRRTG